MDKLLIVPNEEKYRILNIESKNEKLQSIKYMTKKEFMQRYLGTYSNKTINYLVKKYKYNLDVAKTYLNNLKVIDINKEYKNKKLIFLRQLKKELLENNLIEIDDYFKTFIKDKIIEVSNYYDLDKYEEEILNIKVALEDKKIKEKVHEFETIEDEIAFIAVKITDLIKTGVNPNKILIANITEEYLNDLEKIFNMFNIPININRLDSIFSSTVVKNFLETRVLDFNNKKNLEITTKISNILTSLHDVEKEDSYDILLIDKLKNTYFDCKKYKNAVNIIDITKRKIEDDEYVFFMGFNEEQNKTYKDIDFITDDIKEEVNMYKTSYLNKRQKEVYKMILGSINNLYLSYKLKTKDGSFCTPSSLIKDLGIETVKELNIPLNYSNEYNKEKLSTQLDDYYLYNKNSSSLKDLLATYEIEYNTYKNDFTKIDKELYKNYINNYLKLSYTSLNTYTECAFKYYISRVLKIEEYEKTFQMEIGNLYHEILSLYINDNFNFEILWDNYLKNHEFSSREKILLKKLKQELIDLINNLRIQEKNSNFNDYLLEKEAKVVLDKEIYTEFVGKIDKIMYYKKIDDTYYSVIDYKTGSIDTHIEPIKYGLHMQLPSYLYLINKSKLLENPILAGIYYQNILFEKKKVEEGNKEKEKIDRLKLQGYSTENKEILEIFDKDYEKSNYIKSMSITKEGNFNSHAKILSEEDELNLLKYTEKIINEKADDIINAKFDINPKVYGKDEDACEHCPFRDLCFRKEKDKVYLEKVNNLEFLGGE